MPRWENLFCSNCGNEVKQVCFTTLAKRDEQLEEGIFCSNCGQKMAIDFSNHKINSDRKYHLQDTYFPEDDLPNWKNRHIGRGINFQKKDKK
jgi:DNA-directed RNA polymerase subunit RPC12/RpoP